MTTRISRALRAAAATTLALLLVTCTTEQQSTPGPTLTSTTSTTTTTAPPSTTTVTVPETTEPVETTTTPPTTLPAGPADELVPLFIGGAERVGWLFLGAWQQDRWQEATDPSGNPIRPGIEAGAQFTVSNLDGETSVALGENTEACFDERVGPAIDIDVAAPDPPGYGYSAVAVFSRPWPLKPRPVAVTSTAPDTYQALGEAAFVDNTVDATRGDIEQVVIGDLDGDGDDEAMAAFEFVQPSAGPGAPGDLAALLLIDVGTRTADTVLLSTVAQDVTSTVAPDVTDDGAVARIARSRVLDVADLNGDGRMEVLVHAWYFEGASVLVYTYDGNDLTEVLATGCGP